MISVYRSGYNFIHQNGICVDRPLGTQSLLFLHFKTPVDVLINGEMVSVTEPAFLIYDRETPQFYKAEKGPYNNDFIHFIADDYDKDIYNFFKNLNIPLNTLLYVHNSQEISAYFKDISREFRLGGNCHEMIIDMKLKTLFCKFSDVLYTEQHLSDKLIRYRQPFVEIRNSIYNFSAFNPDKNVNELAKSLNISTSYFQHIYKQLFNVSVMQDIIKSRLEYACHLLNSEYDSITDIAAKCGYENKEHFTRQFKEIIGMTPNQYRNSLS